MKINVQNILKSNIKNMVWDHVEIDRFYDSKIIEAFFGSSRFGGKTFKVIFKIIDKEFFNRNISLFMTYTNKDDFVSNDFINFIENFIDLKNVEEFEIEDLINKKCKIFVENNINNKNFQIITKIKPFIEKLEA